VIGNERFQGLTEAAPIAAYTPLSQTPSGAGVLLVRAALDPIALASSVRRAIHEIDPALAVFAVEPLRDTVSRSVSQQRFTMFLLGSLAALALLLAAIGIHGLLSYSAARRRQEIGIRMALGADRGAVLGLFVRDGVTVIACGLVCGFAGAIALTRVLRTLLFGVTPTDPMTFLLVAVVLSGVALGATLIPAHRAARVDPLLALRSE
jgi:ABC-type antimicrobial peptide transport system permease subunit